MGFQIEKMHRKVLHPIKQYFFHHIPKKIHNKVDI